MHPVATLYLTDGNVTPKKWGKTYGVATVASYISGLLESHTGNIIDSDLFIESHFEVESFILLQ